jgi:hypothetical protein
MKSGAVNTQEIEVESYKATSITWRNQHKKRTQLHKQKQETSAC